MLTRGAFASRGQVDMHAGYSALMDISLLVKGNDQRHVNYGTIFFVLPRLRQRQ